MLFHQSSIRVHTLACLSLQKGIKSTVFHKKVHIFNLDLSSLILLENGGETVQERCTAGAEASGE